MKPVTRILSDQQGRYEWCERDCLTTASLLVQEFTGKPLRIKQWRLASEARAVAKAVKRYGSTEAGHASVLTNAGYEAQGANAPLQPGDILSIATPVQFDEGPLDNAHRVSTLAFVADTYEVYTWAPQGLRACLPDILEVFRCPKP